MSRDKEDENGTGLWPLFLALAFVSVIWGLNWYILASNEDRGVYGDMFGAANSLFSGLAFAGVVYAIFLQRHEVAIARQELKRTKELLAKQQELAVSQEESQRRSTFENTFFRMLELFARLVTEMDLRGGDSPSQITKGKDVFPVFMERVRKKKQKQGLDPLAAYEDFYSGANSELGHYFRTLYNIVKLIDASEVDNKRFYSNLVRAQLSDAEANLLFLNGLSNRGKKFKPLIEKYALLKNVDTNDDLIDPLVPQYDPAAF